MAKDMAHSIPVMFLSLMNDYLLSLHHMEKLSHVMSGPLEEGLELLHSLPTELLKQNVEDRDCVSLPNNGQVR